MGNVCCEEPSNTGQIKVAQHIVVYDPIEYKPYNGKIKVQNLVNDRYLQIQQKLAQFNTSKIQGVIKRGPYKQTHHNFIYEGTWKNNVPEGVGKILFENGEYFEGQFKAGKANGSGIYIFENGDYFYGQIEDNKASGKGSYTGSLITFNGQWENSKPTVGKYELREDQTRIDMEKDGKGQIRWANGNRYSGDIKNQKPDGFGLMLFDNGNQYQGYWKNGFFEGQGKFVWKNGKAYKGQYAKGVKQGLGEFIYDNKRKYRGDWKNGKQNGNGKLFENEELVYEGNFKDGVPSEEKVEQINDSANLQISGKIPYQSKPLSNVNEGSSNRYMDKY